MFYPRLLYAVTGGSSSLVQRRESDQYCSVARRVRGGEGALYSLRSDASEACVEKCTVSLSTIHWKLQVILQTTDLTSEDLAEWAAKITCC